MWATPGSAATPSGGSAASPSYSVWADETTKAAGKGWVYAYAPADIREEEDPHWFYLEKDGVPFNEGGKDTYQNTSGGWDQFNKLDGRIAGHERYGAAARVIDKKTYLFDSRGRMLTGVYYLQGIKRKGGSTLGLVEFSQDKFTGAYYCFDGKEGAFEGRMLTGKQAIEGEDGEIYHYFFRKDGRAYENSIVEGSFYDEAGLRLYAEEEFQLVTIENKIVITDVDTGRRHSNCAFILDDSGRLKKSGAIVLDGYRYTVKDYEVVRMERVD